MLTSATKRITFKVSFLPYGKERTWDNEPWTLDANEVPTLDLNVSGGTLQEYFQESLIHSLNYEFHGQYQIHEISCFNTLPKTSQEETERFSFNVVVEFSSSQAELTNSFIQKITLSDSEHHHIHYVDDDSVSDEEYYLYAFGMSPQFEVIDTEYY